MKDDFRSTKQRQVILEELRAVTSHPTADEMYEMIRRRLPRVSLGTIYRNLEMLSEAGVIQKLDVGGAKKRFDGDTSHHYHLRCLRCGRVEDVGFDPEVDLDQLAQAKTDFRILRHRLEFIGTCVSCQAKPQ